MYEAAQREKREMWVHMAARKGMRVYVAARMEKMKMGMGVAAEYMGDTEGVVLEEACQMGKDLLGDRVSDGPSLCNWPVEDMLPDSRVTEDTDNRRGHNTVLPHNILDSVSCTTTAASTHNHEDDLTKGAFFYNGNMSLCSNQT